MIKNWAFTQIQDLGALYLGISMLGSIFMLLVQLQAQSGCSWSTDSVGFLLFWFM